MSKTKGSFHEDKLLHSSNGTGDEIAWYLEPWNRGCFSFDFQAIFRHNNSGTFFCVAILLQTVQVALQAKAGHEKRFSCSGLGYL
jgi:hypothetical protein